MSSPTNSSESLEFSVDAIWSKDKYGKLYTTQLGNNSIGFACPIPFGGVVDKISPEEMFLASIATCTLTTILHLKDKVRTTLEKLSVSLKSGIIQKENNDYEFKDINCDIIMSGSKDDEFLFERICSLAPKHCLIKKSITKKITYSFTINDKIYNPVN